MPCPVPGGGAVTDGFLKRRAQCEKCDIGWEGKTEMSLLQKAWSKQSPEGKKCGDGKIGR